MCKPTPIHTEQVNGFKIEIWQDDDSLNPFTDWDTAGELTFFDEFGRVWQTNDKNPYKKDSFIEVWENGDLDGVLFLVSSDQYHFKKWQVSVSDFDENASFNGFIHLSKSTILEEWGDKETEIDGEFFTPVQMAERYAVSVLGTIEDWLNGNVYGYEVFDSEGEKIEACWGYFGDYDEKHGALSEAFQVVEWQFKKRAEAEVFALAHFQC